MIGGLVVIATFAQAPQRDIQRATALGTARVTGSVVADDQARTPVRRATLTLSRAGANDARIIASDDHGLFLFDDLPAGVYTLGASKGGYLAKSYVAPQPGLPGNPIPLAEGQRFEAKPIALTRGAVLTGRLLDARGHAISSTTVFASQFRLVDGQRLRRNLPGASAGSSTDGGGVYRIYGLLPGDYIVSATSLMAVSGESRREVTAAEVQWAQQQARGVQLGPVAPGVPPASAAAPVSGRPFAYAATYYPGTADESRATVITLARGEERADVDFQMQYVPVAHVSGVVIGPDGQPVPGVALVRAFKQTAPLLNEFGLVGLDRTGPDGTFSIGAATPPGEYTIFARAVPGGGTVSDPGRGSGMPVVPLTLWGVTEIAVSGEDVANVVVQLRPGMSIAGRIVFEGSQGPADLKAWQLRLTPGTGLPSTYNLSPAGINSDFTFKFDGAGPGPYRLSLAVPSLPGVMNAWTIKSAVANGKNVFDAPLEVRPNEDVTGVVVTLSDRQAALAGTLVDSTGQPTPQFYLLAYPVDRRYWTQNSRWIRLTRADVKGVYDITGLPAGEYYLCASTELDPSAQYEPAYLEQLVPASIKITLKDGEKRVQTLRVGG